MGNKDIAANRVRGKVVKILHQMGTRKSVVKKS